LPGSSAIKLNDAQELVLASAATAPLTVVTGPPGTGKSRTVAAIVADAWLRDETVLVTSTNNTPIDDVINDKMLPLDEALILRTGNNDKRRELGSWLRELVARVPQRPAELDSIPLPEASLTRHRAARALEERAFVQQEVAATAERRDQAREVVWRKEQPRPGDLGGVRSLAEKACRTRWRWLKRRRTNACLARAGIEDRSVTAEQVRDWVHAEDSFHAAWQRLTSMQLARPVDAFAEFAEAEE
jgi:MoxR-like ATPase